MWSDLSNPYNWFLIFIVGGLGILGAYDDYKKIKSGNSGGVSFKFKIISQVIIALIGIYILTYHVNSVELKNLYFPFFKNLVINLGWFFIPFYLFIGCRSSQLWLVFLDHKILISLSNYIYYDFIICLELFHSPLLLFLIPSMASL